MTMMMMIMMIMMTMIIINNNLKFKLINNIRNLKMCEPPVSRFAALEKRFNKLVDDSNNNIIAEVVGTTNDTIDNRDNRDNYIDNRATELYQRLLELMNN